MKKYQGGFTLIELVMVIVILGVLAAFALPRFADLGGDARTASIQAVAGAMKSAANIAHARQLADGSTLGTSVTLEGEIITMVNGYPTANAAGIVLAAQLSGDDYTIGTGAAAGGDEIIVSLRTNCQVTYKAATAATDNTAPITAAPVVTVLDSEC